MALAEYMEEVLVRCTVEDITSDGVASEIAKVRAVDERLAEALVQLVDHANALPLLEYGLQKIKPRLVQVEGKSSNLNWVEKVQAILSDLGGEIKPEEEKDIAEGLFFLAVATLLVFASSNITGPPPVGISESPERVADASGTKEAPESDLAATKAMEKKWLLDHLSVGGEYVVGKPVLVGYMCTASIIFRDANFVKLPSATGLATLPWWRIRALHLHQKLLSKNVASLKEELLQLVAETSRCFKGKEEKWGKSVVALAELECASVLHTYQCTADADLSVKRASQQLGMELKQTGVMGKRTVHQVDAKAQMVLVTEGQTNKKEANGEVAAQEGEEEVPKDWLLEGLDQEDILLAPKLEDEGDAGSLDRLNASEQALVLAWLVHVSKSQAQTEIQSWERMPYVQCIFKQEKPNVFAKMAATLHAAKFERERNRTRERALVRMEKLVEALQLPMPSARKRMTGLFSISFPPLPLFQKEYGEELLANAMVGNALIVFEKFEHWDNLIACYQLLQKTAQAQTLIKERLEESPNDPRLWCALGDVTKDDSCYVEAWTRSGNRHARAQRSLAVSAMRAEDYAGSIGHWEKALALNPLFPSGWFGLGYCYMREEMEGKALHAYTRVTQLNPDNGEAWNNLAALHLKQNSWKKAFSALKEAVRLRRDSWQLWDNYVEAALRSGYIMLAVHGLQRIITLNKCESINLFSLELLVDNLCDAKAKGLEESEVKVGDNPVTAPSSDATIKEDLASLEIDDSDDEEEGEVKGKNEEIESDLPKDVGSKEWVAMEQKILDILKKFAATSAAGPQLWHIFGKYYEMVESWSSMKEMYLKESRSLLALQWKGSKELFKQVVESSKNLMDAALKCMEINPEEKKNISSLKYHFKGILKQALNYFEDTPEYAELQQVLQSAERNS